MKILGILVLAAILAGCTVTLAYRPGSEALAEALNQRDLGHAVEAATLLQTSLTQSLDEDTTARALTELGALAIRSRLASLDPTEGVALLERASALGNLKASLLLGHAYRNGWGVAANPDAAITHYQLAAPRFPQALLELAEITRGTADSEGYFQSYLAQVGPKQMSPGTLIRIARYFRDTGAKSEARAWYRRASDAGNPKANKELVAFDAPPPAKKKQSRQKPAHRPDRKGEAEALLAKARAYSVGFGVEYDLKKSYALLEKAATLGNAEAQYLLGLGYLRGTGVAQNREKARHWLARAQGNGNPLAAAMLKTLSQSKAP